MHSKPQLHTLRSRSISRAAMTALTITIVFALTVVTASSQNVPPTTVREAAASQAVTPRVNHAVPVATTRGPRSSIPIRPRIRPEDNELYNNGPTNGTSNAFFFDVYQVSNSFVPDGSGGNAVVFAEWVLAGATPLTADWSIGTSSFGNDVGSGHGTISSALVCTNGAPFNGGTCGGGFGYDVYNSTITISNVNLASGTQYWLTLTNATDSFGGRDGWDINSGASLAYHNLLGAVPSESFTINGSSQPPPPVCFDSGWNPLQIIHDFTPQENPSNSSSAVTLDKAGNLYGTTSEGGNGGDGLAYKLGETNNSWMFTPLYSFTGSANGLSPSALVVGPDGSLYGSAEGGIQNCGTYQSQWCGLVFNLKALPPTCLGGVCRTEKAIYTFSGNSDGVLPSVFAFDQEGNLYGTTSTGGGGNCNNGCGTVFKLTPTTPMRWAKSTLYRFTGGSDGSSPSQVLVGKDGNLYGIANSNPGNGEVFQLTPAGGNWTLNVLHTFWYSNNEGSPEDLVQDSSGNLYGIDNPPFFNAPATIFTLTKSDAGWVFSEFTYQHQGDYDEFLNLTIDAEGHLYGTGTSGYGCADGFCRSGDNQVPLFTDYIFEAWYADGAWNYQDLVDFTYEVFDSGPLAVDGGGNLYGTTRDCGKHNAGTIWQLSR